MELPYAEELEQDTVVLCRILTVVVVSKTGAEVVREEGAGDFSEDTVEEGSCVVEDSCAGEECTSSEENVEEGCGVKTGISE